MKKILTILPVFFIFALSLYGQDARENFKYAKYNFDEGKYEKALKFVNNAIKHDSSYVNAYFLRAQVYHELGEYQSSVVDINRVLKADRSENSFAGQCHLLRGRGYMELEKYSRARYDFGISKKYTRNDPDVTYYEAMLSYKLGNHDEALLALNEAIRRKGDASYYRLKSEVKMSKYRTAPESREYLSVLSDINTAISIDANNYEFYLFRSKYLNSVGRKDQAMKDFDKMIELSPEKDVAYVNRGIARMNNDDYKGAVLDFNESITINPENANAFRHRGLCYNNLNMHPQAYEDFSESITLMTSNVSDNSTMATSKRELAETYLLRGHSQNIMGSEIQACKDFLNAYELGIKQGLNYYRKFCSIY